MTGIADIYVLLRKQRRQTIWHRVRSSLLGEKYKTNRFVVLSWKRTGSNLLCGILFHHPEILMHNELFNTIDIFTYYPQSLRLQKVDGSSASWNTRMRDLQPEAFLEHIWSAQLDGPQKNRKETKAIGFKSFPEHWRDSCNDETFQKEIMNDPGLKKIILHREDTLAVFVSMLRADATGNYITDGYPRDLKVHICPAKFQSFVNTYRDTFERTYQTLQPERDTFRLSYEQLCGSDGFEKNILPQLWKFLNVRTDVPMRKLQETVQQRKPDEDIQNVISNYDHLEFSFRHTDVSMPPTAPRMCDQMESFEEAHHAEDDRPFTWSILVPICSRNIPERVIDEAETSRCQSLTSNSEHTSSIADRNRMAWDRVEQFAESISNTITPEKLSRCEFIVGVDIDDPVFSTVHARGKLSYLLPNAVIVDIQPVMYGKICRIWNHLANTAMNEFIVLLGDDVRLLDSGWQHRIEHRFASISAKTGLPFGAACVAMNDISFPGFPTFPVIHRWHMEKFQQVLPRPFVNQGGDPYLFELYSRWNASSFEMESRLENTIGGNLGARYQKKAINWESQVLSTNLRCLRDHLGNLAQTGICIDVVVPSFRLKNLEILQRIVRLRASVPVYTKFWIVVDNPDVENLNELRDMVQVENDRREDGNYFVSVLSYGENKGASHARNVGYNSSSADWVIFLDDDVIPDEHLLDAYIGSIHRYPQAKVMVGLTQLPEPCNLWTSMISASMVNYFYGIADKKRHPSWGVTANLMARGSRMNRTICFKTIYPKTGGGEDVDFVFQMKDHYGGTTQKEKQRVVVSVPGAKVTHPWWNGGRVCYSQIAGWAWGDSLCMLEWPDRTFMAFPNWVEFIAGLLIVSIIMNIPMRSALLSFGAVVFIDLMWKTIQFFEPVRGQNMISAALSSMGASTIISSQELYKFFAALRRCSLFSISRRMDWFDGAVPQAVLEYQSQSAVLFAIFVVTCFHFCG